jgi:hypothetical protein
VREGRHRRARDARRTPERTRTASASRLRVVQQGAQGAEGEGPLQVRRSERERTRRRNATLMNLPGWVRSLERFQTQNVNYNVTYGLQSIQACFPTSGEFKNTQEHRC